MSAIPATLVKQLREETGAGMMDCKRALQETDGDLEAARRLLRELGMLQAGKRASRETTEGKVGYRIADDGSRGTMVAIGCETEPVSNNDEFLGYAKRVLDVVERDGPQAAASLEDERVALVGKIGENVVVAGAARYAAGAGETISAYVHPPVNKLGVLVKIRGGSAEAARRLAMHISFAAPRYAARSEVPEDVVADERGILEQLAEVQSKPEAVRPKIVEGMLAKRFFAEWVLADQPWIHESSKNVGQALAEEGAEVLEFDRFALAG